MAPGAPGTRHGAIGFNIFLVFWLCLGPISPLYCIHFPFMQGDVYSANICWVCVCSFFFINIFMFIRTHSQELLSFLSVLFRFLFQEFVLYF